MFENIKNNSKKIIDNIDLSSIKNKKILITGASGLIGINLVNTIALLNQNNTIVCTLSADPDPYFKPLFPKDAVLFIQDLCSIVDNKYFNLDYISEFDFIIHAAGYAQPAKFTNDKIKTIILNTEITRKLFDFLKPNGTFLYCSTSELYSGLEKENIAEDDIGSTSTNHPRACYIESKRCGEAICYAMKEQFNKNIKIARISTVYGPGTKKTDQRVMSELVKKALINNKIELLDSGSSIRTFGYITDTLEMILNIMLFGQETTYNITGQTEISILELAQKISNNIGCELLIPKNSKTLAGNPQKVSISIDRYQQEFNKTNFVSIDDGLAQTISYLKALYV